MVLSAVAVYVSGLSLTTLLAAAAFFVTAVVARRKGYGVRLGLACIVLTALPGSRRFPHGVRVRVAPRILAFLVSGCRGPWLDVSADRFVMRLRAAPPRRAPFPLFAALQPIRRWFAAVSAALAVENGYWRIVAHNLAVHAAVFFLRGVRIRAERVHVWRHHAHWAFKADQLVYVGHAYGVFGSRYDLTVNELSLLSDRYPAGVPPPREPAALALGASPPAPAAVDPVDPVVAAANAARANAENPRYDSERLFAAVPRRFEDMPQPTLTPHTSNAAIILQPVPGVGGGRDAAAPSPAINGAPPSPPSPPPLVNGAPAPLRVSLVLRKGVRLVARLTPRFRTMWRPRRMAIMDDITLTLDVRDVSARAGDVLTMRLEAALVKLCPGYSPSLREKLPPSAPATRRPRKPALLRYWECSGSLRGLHARLVPPEMLAPPYDQLLATSSPVTPRTDRLSPETVAALAAAAAGGRVGKSPAVASSASSGTGGGLFANVKVATFEAFGMAADERQDATIKATCSVEQVYCGSITVEQSAKAQCESLSRYAPPSPRGRTKSSFTESRAASGASGLSTISGLSGASAGTESGSRGSKDAPDNADGSGGQLPRRSSGMRRLLRIGRQSLRRTPDGNPAAESSAAAMDSAAMKAEAAAARGTNEERTGAEPDSDDENDDHDVPPPLEPDVVRALDSFVAARPEFVLWLAGIGATYDMNCAKRDAVRFDVSGDGAVLAIEPAGLLRIIRNTLAYRGIYSADGEVHTAAQGFSQLVSSPTKASGSGVVDGSNEPGSRVTSGESMSTNSTVAPQNVSSRLDGAPALSAASAVPGVETLGYEPVGGSASRGLSRSASVSSSIEGAMPETSDLLFACDLKRCHGIVLGDGPVGDGDTLALIFGAEIVSVPRMIRSGLPLGGFRVESEVRNLRVDHWSQWARTSNLVCDHASFNNMSKTTEDVRRIDVTGFWADWDLDLQSAMEELPERFRRLAKVSSDPMLVAYRRALHLSCIDSMSADDVKLVSFDIPSSDFSTVRTGLGPGVDLQSESILAEAAALAEVERRERRERRRQRFIQMLHTWVLSGKGVRLAASFPDGPRLFASVVEIPSFHLSDEMYMVRHMVVFLAGTKCMYCAEIRVQNPIHSMGRLSPRRHLSVEVSKFRAVLEDDFWFGMILQDWLMRLKAVLKVSREARYRRRGIPMPRYRKKPLPDIHLTFSDCEVSMADSRLGSFLTEVQPLMQDEALERLKRYKALCDEVKVLEQSDTATEEVKSRLYAAFNEQNSSIYIQRMKKHKEALPQYDVAPGYLAPLDGPPIALFTAAIIRVEMTMDDATRAHGSSESIRKLKMLDEYLLGPMKEKKSQQYESITWNSLGFRDLDFEAVGLRLRFRDYPSAFVSIDRLFLDKGAIIGQAQQATVAPYITEATVAIARRRVVKVVKTLASSKTFMDMHLIANVLQCTYNPCYFGSVVLFGRAFSRFLSGNKNPSPRLTWYDSIRNGMHGRFRITARSLRGTMSSTVSPYTETQHYVNILADNFSWNLNRLRATHDEPYPISWEIHNWRIIPNQFHPDRVSRIVLKHAKVSLNPVPSCLSGDAQDHYYFPFVSPAQVEAGEAGTGRALMIPSRVTEPVVARLNVHGHYTDWDSPLLSEENPEYDTFADYKTERMHLGIHINVKQAPNVVRPSSGSRQREMHLSYPVRVVESREDVGPFWTPQGASVIHSDGITTLRRVVGRVISRPVSNRAPPRWLYPGRKPVCPIGLGYNILSLELSVNVSDLNCMVYNNFESQHGLFASLRYVSAGLTKRSERVPGDGPDAVEGVVKVSQVTSHNISLKDFYVAMRAPGLEFADEVTDCGFLFAVDSLGLVSSKDHTSDSNMGGSASGARYRSQGSAFEPPAWDSSPGLHQTRSSCSSFPRVFSTGYGDDDKSPFYTFSAKHPMQRGKLLDKVDYKEVLVVDGIRMLWSPMRRNSLLTWPDAFLEKNFCMSGVGRDVSPTYDPFDKPLKRRQRLEYPRSPEMRAGRAASPVSAAERPANVLAKGQSEPAGVEVKANATDASGPLEGSQTVVGSSMDSMHGDLIDLISPIVGESRRRRVLRAACRGAGSPPDNFLSSVSNPSSRRSSSMRSTAEQRDGRSSPTESSSGRQPDRANRAKNVLDKNAKFQLMVTDSQICFGTPEAEALVILTSEAASVGFVDKTIEQAHQVGGKVERWIEAEYRIHLQRSRLYSQSEDLADFNFDARWVPKEADRIDDPSELTKMISPLTRVTVRPISFNVMYIRSKSIAKSVDDHTVDHILRPSQLFINVPQVSMDSTRVEFQAVTDVVRKVLMQRVPNAHIVKEELALLRYNMQLGGGGLSAKELEEYGRRLNNITKQFLYAGETFQESLVSNLLRIENGDFQANYLRYKARAKAVATQLRSVERSSSAAELFPTMYISYSFDECSWKLRDLKTNKPFVELVLNDLVCRHIFYVGKGISSEFTFRNINALNHQEGGFYKHFLEPATDLVAPGSRIGANSKIKASDGTSVAFRWLSTQMDNVGGIPVYDLLTINVSPMNAAISSSLYKAVFEFAFGTSEISLKTMRGAGRKPDNGSAGAGGSSVRTTPVGVGGAVGEAHLVAARVGSHSSAPSHAGSSASSVVPPSGPPSTHTDLRSDSSHRVGSKGGRRSADQGSSRNDMTRRGSVGSQARFSAADSVMAPLHARSRSQDVQDMTNRGQSTMIFKYIYIGEFQLTASYKKKEDPEAHSVLDISDLTVESPSYMYSSKVWTWRDFARQVKKELGISLAVRGVSNLAKIKLLPGYQRTRRRIKRGTDTVNDLRHGLFDRRTALSAAGSGEYDGDGEMDARTVPDSISDEEDPPDRHTSDDGEIQIMKHEEFCSPNEEESAQEELERRRKVLAALFGPQGARSTSLVSSGDLENRHLAGTALGGDQLPSHDSGTLVATGRSAGRTSTRRRLRALRPR